MKGTSGFCFVGLSLVLSTPTASAAERLQPSDLKYLGAFLLPKTDFFAGMGELGWPNTSGMTFCPSGSRGRASLFLVGRGGRVAEVTLPPPKMSNLETATVLQSNQAPFTYGATLDNDATAGLAYLPSRGSQTSPKLYFGSFEYYNVDVTDYNSLGWAELDLSHAATAGLWHVGPLADSNSGAWNHGVKHGEYLFTAPQAWADRFTQGRSLLVGRTREGGSSGGSFGPTLTAVAPWASGNPPPPGTALPATPLMSFGNTDWKSWRLFGDPDWTYYQPGDRVNGGAWIERGTKRAIVFGIRHATFDNDPIQQKFGSDGSHGGFADDPSGATMPYCYGQGGVECPWTIAITNYKGYHNGPYKARLALVDLSDIERVASGALAPSGVQAYGVYDLMADFGRPAGTRQDRTGSHDVLGVAYDETGGRLYVGQSNGQDPDGHPNPAWPVIHVYEITAAAATPLAPPRRLVVQ